MTHFPILSENVCVAPIFDALLANPDLWNSKEGRKDLENSPHKEAPDIWLRYNDYSEFEKDRNSFNDEHIPVWYDAWNKLPQLRPVVFGLMAAFEGEMLGGVLITKVPAGKKVYPHVDDGWHVQYYDKFYIQIQGAKGCDFCCQEDGEIERFNPKTGQLYMFDNRKMHWVDNDSDVDRITLIVCIRTQVFGRK